jgi:hypothetical protein
MPTYPISATLNTFLLPNRAAILPLNGIIVICPNGSINSKDPSIPSDNSRCALISGILLAQLPKQIPMIKKYTVSENLVLFLLASSIIVL